MERTGVRKCEQGGYNDGDSECGVDMVGTL